MPKSAFSNPVLDVALFWIDPEGRILDASDGACRALGYDREALLTLSVRDVDSEFPGDRWPDHWRELRQAKTLHFRTTHRRRDGSLVPVEVTAHHVELAGREYNCALVSAITPQRQPEIALRESEERLALALAVSGQGLYDLDIATGRTVFSDEYARMLGYEPSELVLTPATWASWLHPEEREEILHLFEDCVTGKRAGYRAEFRLRARSGEWIWVLSAGKVVQWDAAGRPVRMVGTHLDITERKRTEAALRESEERFTKAFHLSPAPMAISEIETGRFLDTNAQVQRMLGYTREEMVGHTSTELGVWADPGTRERMIGQIRMDGVFREMPTRFRTKTGDIREVLWSVEVTHLGERNVLLSLIFDITERKRAEELLKASTERLRLALQAALMGTWEWDIMDNHVVWSTETQNIFGVGADGFGETYQAYLGFVAPEIREEVDDRVKTFLNSAHASGVIQYEHEIIRGDGKTGWVEVRGTLFLNKQNQPDRMTGICADITERKRAEAELERHREHLEELVAERTAELRQAMTQLVQSEKLAALSHLVAGVAHELNTPLGNTRVVAGGLGEDVRAFAAAVESGALRRSQVDVFLNRSREAVDLLERNAARAADLIGHLKQVAVDQTSARRRRFDLRQTIEELFATLQPQFKHTAHRIELDIPPDIALDSYPGPLEQVVANLVDNSLTHGFAGIEAGMIRIRAALLGTTHVQFDYTDNGVGVAEEILKQIFEPFFTTKLGSGGSGLGLYIVYNLVTGVLRGTIQACGRPGGGIAFNLILPRIAPDQPILEIPA